MPYIFYFICVFAIILYGFNIFIYPSKKEKEEQKDLHTKDQIDFFKGEQRPSVNYKGTLINMDEHADNIWDDKK